LDNADIYAKTNEKIIENICLSIGLTQMLISMSHTRLKQYLIMKEAIKLYAKQDITLYCITLHMYLLYYMIQHILVNCQNIQLLFLL